MCQSRVSCKRNATFGYLAPPATLERAFREKGVISKSESWAQKTAGGSLGTSHLAFGEKGNHFWIPKSAGGSLNPDVWLLNKKAPTKNNYNKRKTTTIEEHLSWEVQVRQIWLSRGPNGVAMVCHGLILWENEATGSRKVFRYLLDDPGRHILIKNGPSMPGNPPKQVSLIFRTCSFSR